MRRLAPDHRARPGAGLRGGSARLRVAILYDAGADDWSPADIRGVLASVAEVSAALKRAGHSAQRVAVREDFGWLDVARKSDLVFNLCEGVGGVARREIEIGGALALTGIPYTGVDVWTMTTCHRKPLANAWLAACGVPVPRWSLATRHVSPVDVPLPAIVKPAEEDASVGINQRSVASTPDELERLVAQATKEFGEVIVQQYIEGREIAAGFVGKEVLPLSEIDFSTMPAGSWPIVSFDGKWNESSPEYSGTTPICPAAVDRELAERIRTIARMAWHAVRGWGYGRVDFRVDPAGEPWVLEVNPNPDISSDAGLVRMAGQRGWTYDELIARIAQAALERPAPTVWGRKWPAPAPNGACEPEVPV